MKTLIKSRDELEAVGRWDIDFHLPPEGIEKFPVELLKRVDSVADVVTDKRDPGNEPDSTFQYIDIASVDVTVGTIVNPQEVEGCEAPSRARKVVSAFDVVVSTCRPTRGAIAVVPVPLHDHIASTAFSIVRAHADVNPFYLHFALRLPSSLEQFRKWSTGSSYPAILDSDVRKTLIPVPSPEIQDAIAVKVVAALQERAKAICAANAVWGKVLGELSSSLTGERDAAEEIKGQEPVQFDACTLTAVQKTLAGLAPIRTDTRLSNEGGDNTVGKPQPVVQVE